MACLWTEDGSTWQNDGLEAWQLCHMLPIDLCSNAKAKAQTQRQTCKYMHLNTNTQWQTNTHTPTPAQHTAQRYFASWSQFYHADPCNSNLVFLHQSGPVQLLNCFAWHLFWGIIVVQEVWGVHVMTNQRPARCQESHISTNQRRGRCEESRLPANRKPAA